MECEELSGGVDGCEDVHVWQFFGNHPCKLVRFACRRAELETHDADADFA
jgi:hypothetical protein